MIITIRDDSIDITEIPLNHPYRVGIAAQRPKSRAHSRLVSGRKAHGLKHS